ncbi:hypothetical protein NEIRO03_2206 [Nematocida sp. AWRm78]|nr:hypothetical protein NEIRO02_2148 [Nematocida sp. AWRm79]KAI5186113.1 hypothetical protein NEIRO03_2206 [Nematocida sp. AWRm78]
MVSYIDRNILRTELQKEVNDKQDAVYKYIDIFNIIAEINKKRKIFTEIPEPLANLAYNILYKKVDFWDSSYTILDYDEENIRSKLEEFTEHIDMIVDIIMKAAEELDSEDKKDAFYRLMGNNHAFVADAYVIREEEEFFNSSINILCEKAGIQELDKQITQKDIMVKLCELTESKECSRLQRVLDIIMKHGDNLTIKDENGIKQSNADNLGITKDDIYSLQLLTKTGRWDIWNFINFLTIIYNSIYVKDNKSFFSLKQSVGIDNDNCLIFPIYGLYNTVNYMSIDDNDEIDIPNKELYKKQNTNKIKKYLKQILNKKRIDISNTIEEEIKKSRMYNDIKDHKDFNITDFKNNVVVGYLKAIESNISIILGTNCFTESIKMQINNETPSDQQVETGNTANITESTNTSNATEEIIGNNSIGNDRIQNNGIDSKVEISSLKTPTTSSTVINNSNPLKKTLFLKIIIVIFIIISIIISGYILMKQNRL